MTSDYKLGTTYVTKDNEITKKYGMQNEFAVVVREHSANTNLLLQAINSRRCLVEKSTIFRESPSSLYAPVFIYALDLIGDEICIKDNTTGIVIYGDCKHVKGANKIIEFTSHGNDLIANVQFEIETIEGELLSGYLYCTHQPKNFYLQ